LVPVRVVFGDYEFDARRRLLLRHGRATPLSLKAFELLECLLDRRPEAVSKTELVQHLWPDTFVSDASLHNIVAEVRAALVDDPRTPRYIRTVPRYGYAFHGDAQPFTAAADEVPRTTKPGPRLVSRRREWPLSQGASIVGRDRECVVRIDSPSVSRRHARIVVTGAKATIEDQGSKNGTSVNGNEVRGPVELEEGAQVRIGSVTMTYRTMDALPSTRTVRRI
jgi:DNA-binding winged helix-turn-helix (wHTH) protein